jgi:hypothetical protein
MGEPVRQVNEPKRRPAKQHYLTPILGFFEVSTLGSYFFLDMAIKYCSTETASRYVITLKGTCKSNEAQRKHIVGLRQF